MNTYTAHEAANLFPMIEGENWTTFVASIERDGLQEPITLYQGQILDGRNRYAACQQLGIEPRFETRDDIPDPLVFVLAKNLERRHLTQSQRAAIAVHSLPLFEARAKERQVEAGVRGNTSRHSDAATAPVSTGMEEPAITPHGRAVDEAARALGVSASYIAEMKAVKRHAPHLVQAVRDGALTVNAASNQMRKRREEEERLPAFPRPKAPRRRAATSPMREAPDTAAVLDVFHRLRREVLSTDPRRVAEVVNGREEAHISATARDLNEWVSKVRLHLADKTRRSEERE